MVDLILYGISIGGSIIVLMKYCIANHLMEWKHDNGRPWIGRWDGPSDGTEA